jgi:dihydrofolate reductase
MRKMIESTLVSLNGVIGDPHIWASPYFDDEATAMSLERLRASDAMVMGRRTYEIFSSAWPFIDSAYARRVNEIQKYVFSSTLETAEWSNSTIINGDVVTGVAKLKEQGDGDLVMYGHGPLGQALLEHDLLDEVHYWIHPLFVGKNTRLFREGEVAELRLRKTKTLASGVVILSYTPQSAP